MAKNPKIEMIFFLPIEIFLLCNELNNLNNLLRSDEWLLSNQAINCTGT